MKQPTVSAIIIAKNEAAMLPGCLRCLQWCDEVLIVDDGSQDSTVEIADQFGARLISFKHRSFARKRDEGAKHAKSDWILFIDADERISPQLAQELQDKLMNQQLAAFQLRRTNVFFGKVMQHGGWEHDMVTRLFRANALKGWTGEIHESPNFTGEVGSVDQPLIHFSHRAIRDGLRKSADWTNTEAQLLIKAGVSPVRFWTVIRKGMSEFWRRAIVRRGYQDGQAGLMESLIQAINRMLVYMQVWELQQNPPIDELYAVKERELEIQWEQHTEKEKTS